MSVKAGVWIDHQQAVLVLITDAGKEIKKLTSGIEGPGRSRSHNSYTPNDFTAEDRLERKFESHLKDFYDEVIARLQASKSILILGPGEAKGELHKRLASKKLHDLTVEVETADRMTDHRLAAKVAQHFAAIPARHSISRKKTAKTKVPKDFHGINQ